MKKLIASLSLVLVVALGVVGFSACKKTSVVGKWNFAKFEYYKNGQLVDSSTDRPGDAPRICVINKNGTGYIGNYSSSDEFTWKKSGSKYIISYSYTSRKDSFQIKKGKLVTTFNDGDGGVVVFTFKKSK